MTGLRCGSSFVWALMDALHWRTFQNRVRAEVVFMGTPLALAMLSPRRLPALFIGSSLIIQVHFS
jgi:hypothetical protein